MTFDQSEFDIRCEWGLLGVRLLAPVSDAVIIVDVFSFCTSVDIAAGRGAVVYPYTQYGEDAQAYAGSLGALLAGSRWQPGGYSLSPESLQTIPPGTRLVLPSPNGSTLSLEAHPAPVFAGCLRNAAAVAEAAARLGRRIAVIPAGERWRETGSLRPAFEDLVGAGAIIAHLPGSRSPEAQAAQAAFESAAPDLETALRQCGSGKELIERGFGGDVHLGAQINASACAPRLVDGGYTCSG